MSNPSSTIMQERSVTVPRLNFAGVCMACTERDCEKSACLAFWSRLRWIVCPICNGGSLEGSPVDCCTYGAMEIRC
ncbi:hypothetical protein [Pilimelia columellifera]|uniref:Uncharacterized protein n=1 Tax=Pilimelia columellifera subsp. columellifera TaxID=706583 RepID=A0ABN3NQ92_9ACTN